MLSSHGIRVDSTFATTFVVKGIGHLLLRDRCMGKHKIDFLKSTSLGTFLPISIYGQTVTRLTGEAVNGKDMTFEKEKNLKTKVKNISKIRNVRNSSQCLTAHGDNIHPRPWWDFQPDAKPLTSLFIDAFVLLKFA